MTHIYGLYVGHWTIGGYSGGCRIWTGYGMHKDLDWRPSTNICLN